MQFTRLGKQERRWWTAQKNIHWRMSVLCLNSFRNIYLLQKDSYRSFETYFRVMTFLHSLVCDLLCIHILRLWTKSPLSEKPKSVEQWKCWNKQIRMTRDTCIVRHLNMPLLQLQLKCTMHFSRNSTFRVKLLRSKKHASAGCAKTFMWLHFASACAFKVFHQHASHFTHVPTQVRKREILSTSTLYTARLQKMKFCHHYTMCAKLQHYVTAYVFRKFIKIRVCFACEVIA